MTEPQKPFARIGYGTGNPSGFPDFRPMNPWGRAMPKPSRPMPHPEREGRPGNMRLYQIWADDVHFGYRVPVGPKVAKEILEPGFEQLCRNIIDGTETRWKNASLDPAEPMLVL
jgi:hypothetical protein